MVGREPFIAAYMMANRRHGTLYVGVTSELITRVTQHRGGAIPGFTATHKIKRLVWYQAFDLMTDAIHREKQLKKYKREWKVNLIERENLYWDDLLPGLLGWRADNPWGQPRP